MKTFGYMRKSLLIALSISICILFSACGSDSISSEGGNNGNLNDVVSVGDIEYGATFAIIKGLVNLSALNIGSGSFEYGAQVSITEDYSHPFSKTTKSLEGNEFEVLINQLPANSKLYYRVFVRIGGNVYYSKSKYFTTKDYNNITSTGGISNITLSSAVAICDVNLSSLGNESYGLGIAYSLSKEMQKDVIKIDSHYNTQNLNDGHIPVNIKGLLPATTYYYCSYTRSGENYKYGEIKSFTTLSNDKYEYLNTLEAIDISGTRATLKGWSKLESLYERGSVKYYFNYTDKIEFITTSSQLVHLADGQINNGYITAMISSLSENTQYYYRIVAEVDNIIIAKGEIQSFTTDLYEAPEGYSLVWHDEFDKGSELNGSDWTHEVQKDHWVNNELQSYVNHKSPDGKLVTEIKGGKLHINCFKENGKVYSGRVYAHVNEGWQYGYFEASIKLPKGKGTWPAFWMMPVGNDWNTNPWPMCGEIDIMEEVGVVPNEVSSSVHTQDYNHTKNTQKTHAMTIADAEGAFHTYALLWTPDEITTYVDGQEQLHVTKAALGSGHNQWPFHYAFYPIFNLAWGGDWGGMQGVDEGALPITMEIDYIRIFQK